MNSRLVLSIFLLVAALSAGATLTFAAVGTPPASDPGSAASPVKRRVVVVPLVLGQPYVFAKGMLEERGFAWRVRGGADGFAANIVAAQHPSAGTRLVDTGAPTIVLRLSKNASYAEHGTPENFSPYQGTKIELLHKPATPARFRGGKDGARAAAPDKAAKAPLAPVRPKSATPAGGEVVVVKRARTRPAAVKAVATPKASDPGAAGDERTTRPPAFLVKGAPREPLHEMPLPDRARMLAKWLEKHPEKSRANARHWLYQHAWIVYGAKFGWWHGAEALEILLRVDRRAQQLWRIGERSEAEARATLAEVRQKSAAAR